MRQIASLLLVLAAIPACATDAPSDEQDMQEMQPEDEQITNPDPEVDLCNTTDGVCLASDKCAASDPDCTTEEPPPNCTPNPLPPVPAKLTLKITGLFSPQRVTIASDRFYVTAFTNASPSTTKVYTCPLTGCSATPASFGSSLDDQDSFVAAIGGYVYWSQKSDSLAQNPNKIIRANADGGAQTTVISAPDGAGYYGAVSRNVGIYDDYALVFDVVSRTGTSSSSTSTANAGVRVATDSLMSPALPGISAPPYSNTSVAGNDSYIAYHADPIGGSLTAPYDRKLHIYDLDGNQVGSTAMAYTWMRKLEFAGDKLLFMTDNGWYACSLPGCTDVKNIGTAVNARGFTFAVANDRVYFASVADQGCNKGLTGVLASCTADSLFAGTCTPTLHSTSFHWVNLNTLGVNATDVVMTTRTDTLSVYGASL
jgi:hypothetical protein